MDIYDRLAERMHLEEMEVDTAQEAPPQESGLVELQYRPPRFTLEFGYHGFENMQPWPSPVQILPNDKLLVDYNRWPTAEDVPVIGTGRGVFPFRWGDKRISQQMTNEEAVHQLANWIATQPLITTIKHTSTLFVMLNGVELQAPISEKNQQPLMMLSTDTILFYLQIIYIMKDNEDSQGKTLTQLARCLENFDAAKQKKLEDHHALVTNDPQIVALAKALLEDPDISHLNAEQRKHLVRYAELLEMYSINFTQLLEALIFNMAPYPDLAADSEKFNRIYKRLYLSKGGLPADFDAELGQQFLGNQLAILRCKFEQKQITFPDVSLTMEQCNRGLNMQACALFLYFMYWESSN